MKLQHYPPDPGRSPEEICQDYDIGLALEQPEVFIRDICLCYKPFTYLIAGLAIAATMTRGQKLLVEDIGDAGLLYEPGDVESLAAGLTTWMTNPAKLQQAKLTAWNAAVRRWHWEHPLERGALLAAVERVIGKP
jgi:hypothetical protein